MRVGVCSGTFGFTSLIFEGKIGRDTLSSLVRRSPRLRYYTHVNMAQENIRGVLQVLHDRVSELRLSLGELLKKV